MKTHSIGIYTRRQDLVRQLRERCPDLEFSTDETEKKGCRIIVVDSDSHAILETPPPKSLVRVVLCDGTRPAQRRNGEIRVARNELLASPQDYLLFAYELADAAIHASQLEQQVTYLNEIHDMMSMVEADAVS